VSLLRLLLLLLSAHVLVSCIVDDFETNASRYEPHELVYTLRAYGQLNYVPPNSSAFFGAVERILLSKFSEFDAASILEMLVSFVYIERFPVNFLGHIVSPHLLVQIKGWYLLALSFTFNFYMSTVHTQEGRDTCE